MTNGECGVSGEADWQRAHRALSMVARRRAQLDGIEAKCLLEAERTRVHRHLGFGSFAEYVERLLGYTPRTLDDKLRVARALESLPETRRALECATLGWSAVREVTRVATSATEKAWIAAAVGRTLREVERLVFGRAPGDLPGDPQRAEFERYHLHFEVSAETLAVFRDALRALRRRSHQRLDDNAALSQMAREVLGGPRDDGRATYQIVVSTCDECQRTFQQCAGRAVEVSAALGEMAACDGQRVCAHVSTEMGADGSAGNVTDGSIETGADRSSETGADRSARIGTNGSAGSGAGKTADGSRRGESGARRRATQVIPPAVRRQVVLRDRRCCRVPGCRNATFVDVHHIIARSEGGGHDADNLIVLCSAHHRAVHEGKLLIQGTRAATLSFCHADGRIYGDRGELQRSPPTLASSITISTPGSRPCSQHFCLTQAREGEHG